MSWSDYLDLVLASGISTISLAAILLLAEGSMIRAFLSVPFTVFLPGYALISALYPSSNREKKYDGIERFALSLGLSILVVALIGLGLAYISALSLRTSAPSIFSFTMIFSALAFYRRNKLPADKRFSVDFQLSLPGGKPSLSNAERILAVLIVAALVISAGALAFFVINPPPGERYTEFYILDSQGTANDYPNSLAVGEQASVIINVVCHEYGPTAYTVMVILKNESGSQLNTTLHQYDISLDHEEFWQEEASLSIQERGGYTLYFYLYINGSSTPNQDLHLRITVE